MADWKNCICKQPSTVSISNISNYVDLINETLSPIDKFYKRRNEILAVTTPTFSTANPTIMPLLLVGLISIVENYYRDIISELIKICPISKELSSEKTINLATIWFGSSNLEKGSLENTSFSDSKNISKNLKSIFGIDVDASANQVNAPLVEFGKLCELRHAIVHSGGELSGKNAIKLQLPNSSNSVQVILDYSEMQEAAEICTSLICASNLELFKLMGHRWLHRWPSSPAFAGIDLNQVYSKLWSVFYSTIDDRTGLIAQPLTKIKARNNIILTRAT
ncbi:hypothetical protein [Flavobacterium sp. SORGH_AS_0622]|uniref:hypothetical protein n=1 Tax=Flavobacterium sp. SORGH_AS_0622 TaxID=3041772 RepID=UPI00278ADD1E|nr:hypothetical protein [Flavobacterium sp. SORGH_AS_0622]MDQ1166303.1 hypothetical protein [Flavobacterium sp. SORGH_AS_0622]